MRIIAICILIILSVSLFAVGSAFPLRGTSGAISLHTLDVCHGAAPVVNPELPYLSACPCCPMRPQVAGVSQPGEMKLLPLAPAFPDERPPEA